MKSRSRHARLAWWCSMLGWQVVAVAAMVAPLAAKAGGPESPADRTDRTELETERLPAAGRASTLLNVAEAGRYAIRVRSAQGVSLQLVDRMAGPGPVAGTAGREDGRLDLLLDQGTYRLVTTGSDQAQGEVDLIVTPFVEQSSGPVRLAELVTITDTLTDFEQRSYWLELIQRETVVIRAAGRSLGDVRLWRNGQWLIDAEPSITTVTPRVGQPVRRAHLAADLAPGRYRVTVYGGLGQPWPAGADVATQDRLDVYYGTPALAEAGRARRTIGPFGADHFLIPGGATYFRLELPSPAAAKLTVGRYRPASPWRASSPSVAEIERRSALPVAEIRYAADLAGAYWVTVEGAAGQPYVLQHFAEGLRAIEGADGAYWISTVHAGDPRDTFEATGMLVTTTGRGRTQAEQLVTVGAHRGWAARGNLSIPVSIFLEVLDAGPYSVLAEGVDVRVRLEPMLRETPPGYEPPPWRSPGAVHDLAAGRYLLSIEPVDPTKVGKLDVVVRAANATSPVLADAAEASAIAPGAVKLGAIRLEPKERYKLMLGGQGGVAAGTVVRRLPLDIRQPLPLSLVPGVIDTLLVETPERGRLDVEVEGRQPVSLMVDDQPWSPDEPIEAGRHQLAVRNDGDATVWLSLGWQAVQNREQAVPPKRVEQPLLTTARPVPFALERKASNTFRVRADRAGLYRLETTGLLATEGNLRTRVVTSLDRQRANGVGRNALLQTYLREGDYQFTVQAVDQSTGALGVRLTHAPVRDGGRLRDGIPARGRLPAGEAVAYTFEVVTKGRYAIRALALGRNLRMRLEDADGWPVVTPGSLGALTVTLGPGHYRLIVLPADVDARHLALVTFLPPAVQRKGHGPHVMPFDETIGHRWLEPDVGASRAPDVWRFDLPSPVTARIELTNEMQADIVRLEGAFGETKVGYVPPERGWSGPLEAGAYALRVTCVRANNRVNYQLSMSPIEMFPGLERSLSIPSQIAVSVGTDGLVEMATFGTVDVRARLFDAEGHEVARNDDRAGDWNALIAQRLQAGRYRLLVEAAGGTEARNTGGSTVVSVRAPPTTTAPMMTAPEIRNLPLADALVLVPIALPAAADVLWINAHSAEQVGVAVEQRQGDGWATLAQQAGRRIELVLPIAPVDREGERENDLRMRLWSLDRSGNPLTLDVGATTATRVSEAAWLAGKQPTTSSSGERQVWAVDLARPGCFRLNDSSTMVATRLRVPATDAQGVVAAEGPVLWLAAPVGTSGASRQRGLQGERLVLRPDGEALSLTIRDGARALCDVESTSEGSLVVVEASSAAGAPGVATARAGTSPARISAMVVSGTKASSVAPPTEAASGNGTAEVWARDGAQVLEARLTARRLVATMPESVSWGGQAAALAPRVARALNLPSGLKRIRLVLEGGVIAALADQDSKAVMSVHSGVERRLDERVETTADRLWLLGTDHETQVRFTVTPVETESALRPPTLGAPWVWQPPSAGRMHLEIPAPKTVEEAWILNVRGAEVSFLGFDGIAQEGEQIELSGRGGVATLRHDEGPVLAWLDAGPGGQRNEVWPSEQGQVNDVVLPTLRALDTGSQRLRMAFDTASLLHVRGTGPMVTEVRQKGRTPRVEVHPSRVVLDAYVAPGPATIWLWPLVGGEGTISLESTPVTTIEEGLGPLLLLAAGESRAFAFVVAESGPVGVGVWADQDRVDSILLDADGQVLGRGVIHLHDLVPGTYVLQLSVTSGATPVRARPAVVGLEQPWTGPPAEVLRGYLEHASLAPVSHENPPPRSADDGIDVDANLGEE